jgi:hypothetical protein
VRPLNDSLDPGASAAGKFWFAGCTGVYVLRDSMQDPYATPTAPVADEAYQVATNKIQRAWIAAILVNVLTLTGVMGWVFGQRILDIADIVLVFGLAFGIYKRSSTCATILLIYFTLQKAMFMVIAGLPIGMAVSAVFVYVFVQGAIGCMDLASLKAKASSSDPPAADDP